MSRLYEISYNDNQWHITGSRDTGYTLIHRISLVSCKISGEIIGIEQVTDDEFLVYRRIMRDIWQIIRFKFDILKDKVYQLYRKEFRKFNFLTEDLIIFNKDAHVLGSTLYSISKNVEYDTLNHILSSEPDCRLIKNRQITLLYENPEEDEYPTALYVEYQFNSYPLNICAYLQVVLDVNTFKPIYPVYSTLRDKYFDLSDESITLGQIAREDSYYANRIGNFLSAFYSEDSRKDLEELRSTK
ncbi:MAG: hypothetical protein HFJ41_06185 [Clostridia bacterium]|nr:hypothetical protein [Clostridia bacterium]